MIFQQQDGEKVLVASMLNMINAQTYSGMLVLCCRLVITII